MTEPVPGESIIPVFDAVGALGFAVAAWLGVRSYGEADVERPYWLAFSVTSGLGALWLALVTLEWLGFSGALMDEFSTSLQAVVVGLYAVAVVGSHGAVQNLAETRRETQKHASAVSILGRVLRHDIRNSLTVVRGHVEELSTDEDTVEEIQRKIDDLVETGDKARKLENLVTSPQMYIEVEVDLLLERVKDEVSSRYPDANVTLNCPSDVTMEMQPSLQTALTELVENAAEHSGEAAEITVEAEVTESQVKLHLEDDGPGLPRGEVEVLEQGLETPLYHTSGVGLWLAHWILEDHGGSVSHEAGDEGTRVTVTVPRRKDGAEHRSPRRAHQSPKRYDRYRGIHEEADHGVVVVDSSGTVLYVNRSLGDLLGAPPRDLLRRNASDVLPEAFDDLVTAIETGEPVQGAVSMGADDSGHGIWYSVKPDFVAGESFACIYPVRRDVDGT